MFDIGLHMTHYLHLCSGDYTVVQVPQAGLPRILQSLIFSQIQGQIQEEETEPWK
jgi:hypothetical protein